MSLGVVDSNSEPEVVDPDRKPEVVDPDRKPEVVDPDRKPEVVDSGSESAGRKVVFFRKRISICSRSLS